MRNPNPSSESATTNKTSKVGLKRGPWTPDEDKLLSSYITREGEGRWRTLPKRAGLLRCGKSCRLRWMNYLRPSVKRGQIAPDEEDLILRLHRLLGNRWSLIAGRIPGRTDNEIKNYWNTHLSKKLISQGIDPRTHKPLNPYPNDTVQATAPAPASNPNPNPNPNSSGLEELGDHAGVNIVDSNSETWHLEGTNQIDCEANENWRNSDRLMTMTGLQDSGGNTNDHDNDMDGCTDDVFLSFLNSLINEDMFLKQQNVDALPPDSLVSSITGFGSGAVWDAPVPSTAGVNEEEYAPLTDRVSKCL